MKNIKALLEKRYRAPSAKAWFDLRTRRHRRHKGTSVRKCISRQKVDNWLALPGYPQSRSLHKTKRYRQDTVFSEF